MALGEQGAGKGLLSLSLGVSSVSDAKLQHAEGWVAFIVI
jgi:hypothetical protein